MVDVTSSNALFNNYGKRDLAMVRGEGVHLYDVDGKEYLDFTAGIAVCNLGHAHKGLAEVISKQAETILHTSNLFLVPGQSVLAGKLAHLSGFNEDGQVLFVNSGTEANEAALKLARRYQFVEGRPRQTKVLSLSGGFHGRTMGALSITPKPAYHEGVAPLVPDCVSGSLSELIEQVDSTVAACIVEMVQGESGVRPVDTKLLAELAERLHSVGGLLIVDEVQTGVGRTGTFFAYEQANIEPDIITMAKGLGNGMPVGAVIAKRNVAAAFTPGSHGTTFGGNPLAMAVANYVVDEISEPSFLDHVRAMGEILREGLQDAFDNVTGAGLMWGFDVLDATSFLHRAMEVGVLVTTCSDTRIRIVPPLIVDEPHIRMFLDRTRAFR